MKRIAVTLVVIGLVACVALFGLYAMLRRTGAQRRAREAAREQLVHERTVALERQSTRGLPPAPPVALPGAEAESGLRGSVPPVAVPPGDTPSGGLPEDEALPGTQGLPADAFPPGYVPDGGERPLAPPDVDLPDIPPSMLAQINRFVEESKRSAGPQALEMGEQLLDSTNALLRVAGVAVLSENGALDEAVLEAIALDEDPAVALNALGWLLDNGDTDASSALAGLLRQREWNAADLLGMIDRDELLSSGSRAALEMLAGSLPAEEARDVFGSISEDQTHEYSVRMKSTLLMRDTLDFETYRNEVTRLQSQAQAEDPLWQEGITRLAVSLEGPVEVHGGPATLTAGDIDVMLAREYPMTLEDLAQRLEFVVGQENAYIEQGAAARLNERIAELKQLPWTEDQQLSLTRIESIAAQLPALERPWTEAPPGVAPPPPGAE